MHKQCKRLFALCGLVTVDRLSTQVNMFKRWVCLKCSSPKKKKLSQVQGISRMLCYSFTDDGFYLFLSCPMTNRFWHTTYDLNILTILTIISSLARCYEGKRYNILFISLAAHSNLVYLEYEQQICVLGFSFQFYWSFGFDQGY